MGGSKTIEDYLKKFPSDIQNYYRNVMAGKELLSVKKDTVFKLLFDPDEHKSRLSKFVSLVLGFDMAVMHSLKTENPPRTVVSKKIFWTFWLKRILARILYTISGKHPEQTLCLRQIFCRNM